MKHLKRVICYVTVLVFTLSAMSLFGFMSHTYAEGDEAPGATLFGFALGRLNGGSPYVEINDWIAFSSSAPNFAASISASNIAFKAADIAGDGYIYAYERSVYDAEASVNGDRFYRINPETWQTTNLGRMSEDILVVDVAYASDLDTMYATMLSDDAMYYLCTVDLSNGELTNVLCITDLLGQSPGGLAYIGDGWFITVSTGRGQVIKFNLNGQVVFLESPITPTFEAANSLTYSPVDGRVYMSLTYQHYETENHLYSFNSQTGGDCVDHGRIGGSMGYHTMALFTSENLEYTPTGGNIPTDEEFNAALNVDNGQLNFHNDSAFPWASGTEGGRTYAVSTINDQHSSSTSITANFNGLESGQILSFDWKVSSEANYDMLGFYVNGVMQYEIGGSTGWATKTYTVPSDGDYVFTWEYSKDVSVSNGTDSGYVDNIALTGELPDPEPITPGGSDAVSEALNVEGGSLQFHNSASRPWITEEIDGRSTAKSNTYHQHDTSTYIFIRGYFEAGTAIRFDWKVSSALNDDRLVFKHNHRTITSISGVTDWDTETYIVEESGEYLFGWLYQKNTDTHGNQDCGWLDNIEVIYNYVPEPTPTIDPIVQAEFDEAINAYGESRTFQNDSEHPWIVDDTTDSDRISVRSDIAGIDDCETGFTTDLGYVGAGTTITFDWKTNTEFGWDRLCFRVNSYTLAVQSGNENWSSYTYTIIDDGPVVISWVYEKSVSDYSGADTVWVDNVVIDISEPSETPTPGPILPLMGDANDDGTINVGDVSTMLRYIVNLVSDDEIRLDLCDVNSDDRFNTGDAAWLLSDIAENH